MQDDSVDLLISATDANGDTLTYSATGLPTGLSIDAATGRVTRHRHGSWELRRNHIGH